MTVWCDMDSLLLSGDRLLEIANVTQTLKPSSQRGSEVIETRRFVRVTVWGDMDGLLLSGDRLLEIANVTQT